MYQLLDEQDLWSLVEKYPKETGGAWKTQYKGKFMRIKKIVKIMFFSIGAASILLVIWSIWIKIKANEKAKQHKIGAN
jgi:cell division protein FtsL